MKFTILTAGSRGDTQPYIALGLGLKRAGHQVKIVAFENFCDLVTQHELEFYPIKIDINAKLNSYAGLRLIESRTTPLIVNLFAMLDLVKEVLPVIQKDFWESCQDTDAIINTVPFLGHDIAQVMKVPYAEATVCPGVSSEYPNPFFPVDLTLGRIYNLLTHAFVVSATWVPFRKEIDSWRIETLGLSKSTVRAYPYIRQTSNIPVVYGYSQHIVNRPSNWKEHLQVTGYWFLDQPTNWSPPSDLIDFLSDGSPPVYIGFGSMPIPNSERMTDIILDALIRSSQRAIIAKGWGGLKLSSMSSKFMEIEEVPHEWLFPRVATVICHGGAGTIAASLRAGKVIINVPFFADQFFWSRRLYNLGIGLPPINRLRLTVGALTEAINAAVNDCTLQQHVYNISQKINKETGITSAVNWILNWCSPSS